MAQHDYILNNQSGAAFRSDLNNALAAIVSNTSGTAEPTTTYAYMMWADTTNGKLKLRNGANNAWIELGNLADAGLGILNAVPLGTVSAPGIAFTGDPNTGIYSPGADQLAIAVGGTQRLNITTAALLPTLPLRGADGTAANPAYSFSGDTDTGIYRVGANQLGIATNGTLQVIVDASGNVGIGTSSPVSFANYTALRVGGSSTTRGLLSVYDGTTDVRLSTANDGNGYAGTQSNSPFVFLTNGQERARVTASGRFLVGATAELVGIGDVTTVTGSQLSPDGYVAATRPSEAAGYFTRTGSDGRVVNCYKNSSNVGGISVTTSATSFNTSSDYRLKENVEPMIGALEKISALKPVTYKWKIDGSDGQGFIAHELQAICPDAVTGDKDAVEEIGNILDAKGEIVLQGVREPETLEAGQTWVKTEDRPVYQGIDTSFLVATLTAAIQELKAELDAVKAQLN